MDINNLRQYWEKRLSIISLDSVGYKGLGEKYNFWLYKIKKKQLQKCLNKYSISIKGKTVLDIGAGFGFYVDFWCSNGASEIVGLDIAKTAINFLKKIYPHYSFYCCDISDKVLPSELMNKKFDIISAFDVLYHIVDDVKFEMAIENISNLCKENAYFLLSDVFIEHGNIISSYYIKSRLLKDYEYILQNKGFKILGKIPVFHFMIPPVDIKNMVEDKIFNTLWSITSRFINLNPNKVGKIAYILEVFLNFLSLRGTSTKIMICKKVNDK